jgi:hypothetical protein
MQLSRQSEHLATAQCHVNRPSDSPMRALELEPKRLPVTYVSLLPAVLVISMVSPASAIAPDWAKRTPAFNKAATYATPSPQANLLPPTSITQLPTKVS